MKIPAPISVNGTITVLRSIGKFNFSYIKEESLSNNEQNTAVEKSCQEVETALKVTVYCGNSAEFEQRFKCICGFDYSERERKEGLVNYYFMVISIFEGLVEIF